MVYAGQPFVTMKNEGGIVKSRTVFVYAIKKIKFLISSKYTNQVSVHQLSLLKTNVCFEQESH